MSGGRFEYKQYMLQDMYDQILQEILDNNKPEDKDGWFTPNNFKKETLDEFYTALDYLKRAKIYVHRIDYLLSGDDGEETFHKRLKEDLNKFE